MVELLIWGGKRRLCKRRLGEEIMAVLVCELTVEVVNAVVAVNCEGVNAVRLG